MDPTDRTTAIAIALILVAAVPFYFVLKAFEGPEPQGPLSPVTKVKPPPGWTPPRASANGTSVTDLQPHTAPAANAQPEKLTVPSEPAAPSVIVDVYEPGKLRAAMKTNAWLQETMKQPLGQGFVGPWAGFWGTKGEDVAASFKGEVMDFVADQLLAAPAQVVWFSGTDATSTPVLLVPKPAASAQAAFDALTKAAGHGTQLAERCPGEPAPSLPDGGAPLATHHFEIQRWVLANQAIYAASSEGKLALGRNPTIVLQGLCAKIAPIERTPNADVEVRLAAQSLGHEADVLASLFGVGESPRLAFGLEGDKLVPRGISAKLAEPGRIDTAPLSNDLLAAIPADAPLVLTANLKLPQELDAAKLKDFFAKKYSGPTLTRQVAVVWVPHGDAKLPTEVALLWGRAEDAAALREAFAGKNKTEQGSFCKQLAFASSKALLDKLERACTGKTPSMMNAAGPMLAGLRAPASIGLSVELGALLSGVTLDSWNAEGQAAGKPAPPPQELEAARRQLEQLPAMGFTGTAQGQQLMAGGFHS